LEAEAIQILIEQLQVKPTYDIAKSGRLSLALLTPYRAQRKLLTDLFRRTPLPDWMLPIGPAGELHGRRNRRVAPANGADGSAAQFSDSGLLVARDSLVAHTIDSFQGNQARIVIGSLTRNLGVTSSEASAIEFMDRYRTNVLLSRPEALLVLVGSWSFFRRQVLTIRPDEEGRKMWHWRLILDHLEQLFVSNDAIRIGLDTLRQ
jgi:hypothetical protein